MLNVGKLHLLKCSIFGFLRREVKELKRERKLLNPNI